MDPDKFSFIPHVLTTFQVYPREEESCPERQQGHPRPKISIGAFEEEIP
jgi:hypothetical protein